jgi:hypothetical protein
VLLDGVTLPELRAKPDESMLRPAPKDQILVKFGDGAILTGYAFAFAVKTGTARRSTIKVVNKRLLIFFIINTSFIAFRQ